MGKKSKKVRKIENLIKSSETITVPQLLAQFKNRWANKDWLVALENLLKWAKKSGRAIPPALYGEALFRAAAHLNQIGNTARARELLLSAIQIHPANTNIYQKYLAISFLRSKEPEKALNQLQSDNSSILYICKKIIDFSLQISYPQGSRACYHSDEIITFFLLSEKVNNIEDRIHPDISALLTIYRDYKAGKLEFSQLNKLLSNPDLHELVKDLTLLTAVQFGKPDECFRIIKEEGRIFFENNSYRSEVITSYLSSLLNDKKYELIHSIHNAFIEINFSTPELQNIFDETFFQYALIPAAAGDYSRALSLLLKIKTTTPAVVHNIAFTYQKLEKYSEANIYWLKLIQTEKRPAKNASEDEKNAFIASLKFVASNYSESAELENAQNIYRQILEISPDDKETLEHLVFSDVSSHLEDSREFAIWTKRLLKLEPNNEEFLSLAALHILRPDPDNQQKKKEALEFCIENMNRFPDQVFLKNHIAKEYISQALEIRHRDEIQCRQLHTEAKKLLVKPADECANTLYLEAFLESAQGNQKDAKKLYKKTIKKAAHSENELAICKFFYEDGLHKELRVIINNTISRSCACCKDVLHDLLIYFIQCKDICFLEELCGKLHAASLFDNYTLADVLLNHGNVELALKYSTAAYENDEAEDADDKIIHLLALNRARKTGDLIAVLETEIQESKEKIFSDSAEYFKDLLKEVKKIGYFKEKKWFGKIRTTSSN